MDCIFCKIANGEIPSGKVYEDDKVMAFRDIDPKAPVHVLVIPKEHTQSVLTVEDDALFSRIFSAARKLAKELGVEESGFRLVYNTGKDGGQTVDHMHMHLLGGRPLEWPPG